jgi:iron complex outermembrane recepter protein
MGQKRDSRYTRGDRRGFNGCAWVAGCLVGMALALSPVTLRAQTATTHFEIQAGPLSAALLNFSTQSGVAVGLNQEWARGRSAPALNGSFTHEQALHRLLEGSGLTFEFTSSQTVRIVQPERRSERPSLPALASVPPIKPIPSLEPPPEEITVTGTRLQGIGNASVETRTYNRERIEQSGQSTLTGFLSTLPEVSVTQPINSVAVLGATASVQLRGLPIGTTLVLLNGQRLDTSALAGASFDMNLLPSALVDRVEIVPVGSSAIYGSDAIAGVVNIITKQKTDGFDVNHTYSSASHFKDRRSNASGGASWETGYLSVGLAYQRRSGLSGSDRDATASFDFRQYAAVGGRDARTNACLPGTIASTNGAAISGLGASTATIPANIAGKPTIADFLPGAGKTNPCGRVGNSINPTAQYGTFVSGEQEVGDVKFFGSLLFSRQRNNSNSDFGVALTNQVLPASNYYNPFGQAVLVSTRLPLSGVYTTATNFLKPTVGIKGSFKGWDYQAYAGIIRDVGSLDSHTGYNTASLAAALASGSAATALNPFNPSASAPGVIDSIDLSLSYKYQSKAALAGGYVRGPLFAVPAGDMQLVLGGEIERDTILQNVTSNADASRRTKALFTELAVPLIADTAIGSVSSTAALRYNDYSDFGTRLVPQYGVVWSITPELSLRASYSESFKAPSLTQLYKTRLTYSTTTSSYPDPLNKGVLYNFTALFGGNPALQPETGRSQSIGLNWNRADLYGLRVAATYFRTQEENRIVDALSFTQSLIDNPSILPGRVFRDAAGRLTLVDQSNANFGSIDVAGVDLDLSLRFDTPIGEFTPAISISQFTKYRAAVSPVSGLVDRLGKATLSDVWAPRTRGTLSLGWAFEAYRASLSARYVGPYTDYPGLNNLTRRIGGYAFLDGSFEVDLSEHALGKFLPGKSYIRVTGANLLNKQPTYSNYASGRFGYDPSQDDIIGRLIGVTVGVRW